MSRSYTVIVMSSDNQNIRKYAIGRGKILLFSFVACLILATVAGAIGYGVHARKKLASTAGENLKQDAEIVAQKQKIRFYEKKWEEVRDMVKVVRRVLGLEDEGLLGQGGSDLGSTTSLDDSQIQQEITSDPKTEKKKPISLADNPELIPALKEDVGEVYHAVMEQLEKVTETPFILPIRPSYQGDKPKYGVDYYFSSGFKYRLHPITRKRHFHKGLDIATRKGTPVISTANGIIEKIGDAPKGFGLYIRIRHASKDMDTLYGHLLRFAKGIKKGKEVVRGEVIGYVGSTGTSTGYHLHYGVYIKDIPQNPEHYILPEYSESD